MDTRRYIPPKRGFLREPLGLTSQKAVFFRINVAIFFIDEVCSLEKESVVLQKMYSDIYISTHFLN
jgi:hypothetical protein